MFNSYPYFFANLLGFIPFFLVWSFFPSHRRDLVIAGLYWLPLAPLAVLHQTYWNPRRLFLWNWGVEDLCYLFLVSSLAWFLATVAIGKNHQLDLRVVVNFRRYVQIVVAGLVIALTGVLFQKDVMSSFLAANALVALWLLGCNPSLRPLALASLVTFTPFNYLEQILWLTIWPDFIRAWNPAVFWSQTIWGVPLGELAFHVTFMAASPLGVAYCREASLKRRGRLPLCDE
jgi:hypothetical protein